MKPIIYYIYDAHCGWCFGFSSVMKKIFGYYNNLLQFVTISGELIPRNTKVNLADKADYILAAMQRVQATTKTEFGDAYVQLLQNPNSVIQDSIMPALAMQAVKEYYPNTAVHFAARFQAAHFIEGKNLCDINTYKELAPKFLLPVDEFIAHIAKEETFNKAMDEMDFAKKLGINAYPTLLHQKASNEFEILHQGYANFETIQDIIESKVLSNIK
jgi:putative protein-disulfide isomerase